MILSEIRFDGIQWQITTSTISIQLIFVENFRIKPFYLKKENKEFLYVELRDYYSMHSTWLSIDHKKFIEWLWILLFFIKHEKMRQLILL